MKDRCRRITARTCPRGQQCARRDEGFTKTSNSSDRLQGRSQAQSGHLQSGLFAPDRNSDSRRNLDQGGTVAAHSPELHRNRNDLRRRPSVGGQVAADIRALRRPDSYKGKGIRYSNETVRLKVGKKVHNDHSHRPRKGALENSRQDPPEGPWNRKPSRCACSAASRTFMPSG